MRASSIPGKRAWPLMLCALIGCASAPDPLERPITRTSLAQYPAQAGLPRGALMRLGAAVPQRGPAAIDRISLSPAGDLLLATGRATLWAAVPWPDSPRFEPFVAQPSRTLRGRDRAGRFRPGRAVRGEGYPSWLRVLVREPVFLRRMR